MSRSPSKKVVLFFPAISSTEATALGLIAASVDGWNRHMGILERQLEKSGAYVVGSRFTLADVVLGLSTNRWRMTPMERPATPAIDAWMTLLQRRPGCGDWCTNGTP